MNKILCLGNATWDQTFTVSSEQLKAAKSYASDFTVSGGGVAATAAAAISDCGGNVDFIGRIGNDMIGKQITSELIGHGVNMEHSLVYEHAQSSLATIILADDHSSQIYVFNDPNMPKETSSLFKLDLSNVKAVVADLTWPEGAKVLFERAKSMGIPTFVRVSFYSDSIEELLYLADFSIFNHPSLLSMTSDIDYKRALSKVEKKTGNNQVVTLGNKGCAWLYNNRYGYIKAHEVEEIDSTGAGDIFIGILAMGIGNGEDFTVAVEKANLISSLSCQFMGSRQLKNLVDIKQLAHQ